MLPISSQAKGRQRPKYSFRAFYATVLIISALAVLSFLADWTARAKGGKSYGLVQRELSANLHLRSVTQAAKAMECRLIHQAEDQCAFMKANCLDEDAGIFSYLTFYYCDLAKAQPVAFSVLALWLALLFTTIGIAASDFFCINLSTISSILGISENMAGVTFLAFGNGSPDVFSTFAAMSTNSGSMAVGELIGAAGFITAVVAGSMALVREFKVGKKTFVRDIGFFIVATSFTMIFLADGKLLFWECAVMVAFYVFYVAVVVIWHWYLTRQSKRKARDAAARGHYYAPGSEELEVVEEDDDDEAALTASRNSRATTPDAFGALERAQTWRTGDGNDSDSDDDDKQKRQIAAEMAREMRVLRRVHRRNGSLIRPSLLGALEFRSVLSSLERSRSAHSVRIQLRRDSDEIVPSADLPGTETVPVPAIGLSEEILAEPAIAFSRSPEWPARLRAVTMSDIPKSQSLNPAAFTVATIPEIGILGTNPEDPDDSIPISPRATLAPRSPTFSLSPPTSKRGSRSSSPVGVLRHLKFDQSLAPPETGYGSRRQSCSEESTKASPSASQRPKPRIHIPEYFTDTMQDSPSSITRFPQYSDSPLVGSARSTKRPSVLFPDMNGQTFSIGSDSEETLVNWWPYRFLPSPYVLGSTLFPTLCTWKEKNVWDKFVSLISAPSIFMLAITLPVVESEDKGEDDEEEGEDEETDAESMHGRARTPLSTSLRPGDAERHEYRRISRSRERRVSRARGRRNSALASPMTGMQNGTASIAVGTEGSHDHHHLGPKIASNHSGPMQGGVGSPRSVSSGPQDWNRWLVSLQIFTSPLFIIFVIWANSDKGFDSHKLVKPVIYSLLGSLVTYAILVVTTTPESPPKYRFLFCFAGFAVSVAWISTIAGEVVGVLKAFGIILNISDAILGLTIFAVGNSLGDLVADITVARLGYPVMALSACFGGPMLNILLGIGLGGIYMTVTDAKTPKHPGKPVKYEPYQIQVSNTLMISSITLLVTLVGLLIAVPLNKWTMSRKIGWGLITLWTVSTVANLSVELTGVWDGAATNGV